MVQRNHSVKANIYIHGFNVVGSSGCNPVVVHVGCVCCVHMSCILFVTQSTGWEVGGYKWILLGPSHVYLFYLDFFHLFVC